MTSTTFILRHGKSESKVLVIYTGGTIGMLKNHDGEYDDSGRIIMYHILEYEILLDSSNLTEKEWLLIARDIMKHYEKYDGFVVIHGTDTLSYTASAFSFMFEHLGKPVILTGSQIPIFEARTDGVNNFVSSLIIAGSLNVPEVTIFFGNKLFRGNRTRKISADHFNAFSSPNFDAIVNVGIDMEVNERAIFRRRDIQRCILHDSLSKNVGLLRIFPSISPAVFRAFCQPPLEGVVLQSYGAGNIPSNRKEIFDEITAAVKRNVLFVNITQCHEGFVSPIYETGKQLEEYGVVSGYDMTPEAALTKLSFVLAKSGVSYQEKKQMMAANLRGELTKTGVNLPNSRNAIEENILVDTLAECLNMQVTPNLKNKVYFALLQYAVENGDIETLRKMLEMGVDVDVQNWEGKTVLYLAILQGNVRMVEELLKHGANVHLKTRCGETPLLIAVQQTNINIIDLLSKCGSHLDSGNTKHQAELLSFAARNGKIQKLEALKAAGVNLNIPDELEQTPLHKAVLVKFPEVVDYLVKNGASLDAKDVLGKTALDYAIELKNEDIINKLKQRK